MGIASSTCVKLQMHTRLFFGKTEEKRKSGERGNKILFSGFPKVPYS
jgi:hypothetical protein